jgi:autotransporter-associated beta strand protein
MTIRGRERLGQPAPEFAGRRTSLIAFAAVALVILLKSEGVAQQVPIFGQTGALDPAPIVKAGNTYYYYSTGQGILARSSADMSNWSGGPAIFTTPPQWTTQDVPGFGGFFWAPDVEYFNGLYHLYYSVSTSGSQVSAIGMATSPTLNPSDAGYAWTDHGPVIESKTGYAYNTIDPSVITTPDGSMWMSFGSYWTGIYAEQLDPSTGLLLNPNSTPIHLAQRSGSDTSIEASYRYYRGGYYYLFTNWGAGSTYNVRVGRSTSVNGPFVDQSGAGLLNGAGTLFLSAAGNYVGPGQVGIYSENGKDYVSYFYQNRANNSVDTFAFQDLYWTSDNWPTVFQPLVWNAQVTGPVQDGSGNWDLTATHFLYGANSQTWNNSGYGAVTFGSSAGPAGTVTLAQNVNVGEITFNPAGSGNYTIAGGGFSMNIANGCTITANVDATIQCPIVGAGDLSVNGSGHLLLSGNCSYTGSTTVAGNADLTINGQISSTSNLFLQLGTVTIASGGGMTTAAYTSVGQLTGNNGTLNVNGGLTVHGDLNVGDISATGVMNVSNGATVRPVTLYVGKFGISNGTVTQTGGSVISLPGASDWRVGGGISSADSAAFGLYQLQGGLLDVFANFQIGAFGTGTLQQTGGTANVTGYLAIGRFTGALGLYDMSSGSGTLTSTIRH